MTSLLLLFLLVSDTNDLVLKLDDFGIDGKHTATFLGEKFPTHVYYKSFDEAIANRRDYVLSVDVPSLLFEVRSANPLSGLLLNLYSNEVINQTIVISLTENDGIKNFFVPLAPGQMLTIEGSQLLKASRIDFVSMHSFSGYFNFTDMRGRTYQNTIKLNSPIRTATELLANYCKNLTGTKMRILKVQPHNGPGVETAYFERVFARSNYCSNCGNDFVFVLNVYYPDSFTLFHDGSGHESFECIKGLCCVKKQYKTTALKSGNILTWQSSLAFPDTDCRSWRIECDFDNVLFNGATGVAFCDGEPGTTTQSQFCRDNIGYYWYIYP